MSGLTRGCGLSLHLGGKQVQLHVHHGASPTHLALHIHHPGQLICTYCHVNVTYCDTLALCPLLFSLNVPLPSHLLRNWIMRPLIQNCISIKFHFCVLLCLEGHSHFENRWSQCNINLILSNQNWPKEKKKIHNHIKLQHIIFGMLSDIQFNPQLIFPSLRLLAF